MNEPTLIVKAVLFAAEKHREQRRKDAAQTPYFNHLAAVAAVLTELGETEDPELLAAAYLHDTIEDTGTTQAELEQAFGLRVSQLVVAVSDDKKLKKDRRKQLQIEHAAHAAPDVALLKMADKIANLRSMEVSPPADWPPERITAYYNWAQAVIDALPSKHPRLLKEFNRLQAAHAARAGKSAFQELT
jgi:guanosine-3',5'-bis(diphosphate) 3'-pyrophosphohydrolase